MNKKDVGDMIAAGFYTGANAALNGVVAAAQQHDDDLYQNGYETGRALQRKEDVQSAIRAFWDFGIKENDVYKILKDYFGIDSISEATEYILNAKITKKIRSLGEYCHKQGMSRSEFLEYGRGHKLDKLLAEDTHLLDMSPEKLKNYIDKI